MRFEKMGALVWTLLDFRHWRLNIKDFVLGPVLGPQHFSFGEEAEKTLPETQLPYMGQSMFVLETTGGAHRRTPGDDS